MARIAGVNIPTNKRVVIALQYIHGIGPTKAKEIMEKVEHSACERRVTQLTDAEVLQIREIIDRDYMVEGDLRREVAMNIKRLMDLGCYRGPAPPQGPAGPRPAHPHQCPHPQGPGQGDRRQEEVSRFRRMATAGRDTRRAAKGSRMGKEATRVRRRERKNIASGVAHVNASFNNTMITITDAQGNTIAWSSAGTHGLQGLAQVDALCRAGRRRGCRQEGAGARHAHARSRGRGPGLGP